MAPPPQVLPSVVFWIVTSICGSIFTAVCPYSSADGGAQLQCIVASQHWALWVWWATTVPRMIPRSLRLWSYFKSMERNLVGWLPVPCKLCHLGP